MPTAPDLQRLVAEFRKIDLSILDWDHQSASQIAKVQRRLRYVQRRALMLKLSFQDDTFFHTGPGSQHSDTLAQVNDLLRNIKTASAFMSSAQQDAQSRSIQHLTNMSVVCLPLGILTGFFGMNFAWMGGPHRKGMLNWKYSHIMFWLLFVGTIMAVQVLFMKGAL